MQVIWNLDMVTKAQSSQMSVSWWSCVDLRQPGNGDWEVERLESKAKSATGTKSQGDLQGYALVADRAGEHGWRAVGRNDKKVSSEPGPKVFFSVHFLCLLRCSLL